MIVCEIQRGFPEAGLLSRFHSYCQPMHRILAVRLLLKLWSDLGPNYIRIPSKTRVLDAEPT